MRDRVAQHRCGIDAAIGELALGHDMKIGYLRDEHALCDAFLLRSVYLFIPCEQMYNTASTNGSA